MFFNRSELVIKAEHKHLGMILDSKLTFFSHIKEAIAKARRGIGIIRFLSKYMSRDVLDQIYKLYVRPHLDYSDIIYHKYDLGFKLEFTKWLEQRLLSVEHGEEQTGRHDLRRTWLGNPLLYWVSPKKNYKRSIDHRTKGFYSITNFAFDLNRKHSDLDFEIKFAQI